MVEEMSQRTFVVNTCQSTPGAAMFYVYGDFKNVFLLLKQLKRIQLIVRFLFSECPVAWVKVPRLNRLNNHYPGGLIDQTFSKRRKKILEFSNDILEITENEDVFGSLTYVLGLSEKLKRILQNNRLKVALKVNLISPKIVDLVHLTSIYIKIRCLCVE